MCVRKSNVSSNILSMTKNSYQSRERLFLKTNSCCRWTMAQDAPPHPTCVCRCRCVCVCVCVHTLLHARTCTQSWYTCIFRCTFCVALSRGPRPPLWWLLQSQLGWPHRKLQELWASAPVLRLLCESWHARLPGCGGSELTYSRYCGRWLSGPPPELLHFVLTLIKSH